MWQPSHSQANIQFVNASRLNNILYLEFLSTSTSEIFYFLTMAGGFIINISICFFLHLVPCFNVLCIIFQILKTSVGLHNDAIYVCYVEMFTSTCLVEIKSPHLEFTPKVLHIQQWDDWVILSSRKIIVSLSIPGWGKAI